MSGGPLPEMRLRKCHDIFQGSISILNAKGACHVGVPRRAERIFAALKGQNTILNKPMLVWEGHDGLFFLLYQVFFMPLQSKFHVR